MDEPTDLLSVEQRALANRHGVATEYDDFRDGRVTVPRDTVLAVLAALGVDGTGAPSSAPESAAPPRLLPPCVVTTQGSRVEVDVAAQSEGPVAVWLDLEAGGRVQLNPHSGTVAVPDDLPAGYHTMQARAGGAQASSTVIVAPAFLCLPGRLGTDRAWGFATQLYSVRSRGSWGVGDLEDLRTLAVWSAAELDADYVLVNPLSAAEPLAPMEPSPYLPSSRRFVNPLYIRVEAIPEYDALPPADRATVAELRAAVHDSLDGLDTVDRDTSWTAKATALRLVFAVPRSPERELLRAEFDRREGEALREFATWCAIVEEHGADWRAWPDGLQHPSSREVQDFRAAHAETVDFHAWLQWVLDEQLATVQADALDAGMALGVMHDLAVGVHPSGADSWAMQDLLAQGISVGAPPDGFNQVGQDWSQPPWRPDRLAELGYAPFRSLVSRLLRHAGALRIDHILGLFRLWWIPHGSGADEGTYVRYDHEALIGVLALEAERAGAVVIGEDLGTVEPMVRDYLRKRGVLGTSILWFERDKHGVPIPAERWREYCLASVTTHDLPPTAGYLAGEHVRLRDSLGLLSRPVASERAADEAGRSAWLDLLVRQGFLARDATEEETISALYSYLTSTPSRLLGVSLTDAVGDRRTQNQPGTTDEYPNWRIPLSGPDGMRLFLEDVLASSRARALAGAVEAGLRDGSATRRPAP